jgi:hypothetical protein
LSQQKIEIQKIIEYYNKFEINLEKIYSKKIVDGTRQMLAENKIDNTTSFASENKSDVSTLNNDFTFKSKSFSTLVLHLVIKSEKERDPGIKKIYLILKNRIEAIDHQIEYNDYDLEKV